MSSGKIKRSSGETARVRAIFIRKPGRATCAPLSILLNELTDIPKESANSCWVNLLSLRKARIRSPTFFDKILPLFKHSASIILSFVTPALSLMSLMSLGFNYSTYILLIPPCLYSFSIRTAQTLRPETTDMLQTAGLVRILTAVSAK